MKLHDPKDPDTRLQYVAPRYGRLVRVGAIALGLIVGGLVFAFIVVPWVLALWKVLVVPFLDSIRRAVGGI